MNHLQKRIIRKGWQHLKALQNSPNFHDAQGLIVAVLTDVYGLRNMGVLSVNLNKQGRGEEFRSIVIRRNEALENARPEIMEFVDRFIPARLKNCQMYRFYVQEMNILKKPLLN